MKDDPEHDWLLVEAARKDRRQFAALYEAHFDRVYAFAFVRLWDRQAAEDVAAEVFLRALRSFDRYEFRGTPFAAWLYRIATNLLSDRAARANRERPLVDADEQSVPAVDSAEIEEAERRARLFAGVRALPDAQRQVIEMRFGEERSIRDVAAALNKSEGAIKQLQLRALRALRDRMEEQDA